MPSRLCIHYVSKSGRPSSAHSTGKVQSSSQFPRRVVLKNVLTIRQSHSSPMLVRPCLKSCMLGFSIMQTQMSKLGLENEEELEIKLPTSVGWEKAREFQKNIYFCFIDYVKAFVWIITNWKTLRVGNTRPSYLSPEKPVCGSRRNS